jgi:hypothetical protein
MDLSSIINKIASRTDVLLEVERAFNAKGIYPPIMNSIGPDIYEGEIDTGFTLTVKETQSGLDVKLNNQSVTNLSEAISEYRRLKSQPGAAIQQAIKIAPTSGSVSGRHYELMKYNFNGSDKEHISVKWKDSNHNEIDFEAITDLSFPKPSHFIRFIVNGRDVVAEANNNDWQAVMNYVNSSSGDHVTDFFDPANKILEDVAKKHQNDIGWPPDDGSDIGFSQWIMDCGHAVVNGEFKPNPETKNEDDCGPVSG